MNMSGKGNLAARAFERCQSLYYTWILRETFVGSDSNGNKYFRWHDKDLDGQPIEKRRVRVPGNDLLYDPKIIPAEWRSWLAKTRQEPPTEDEMARSAARAAIMQQRVAAIEEREQQRRYRMESLGKQTTTAGGPDISRFMSQLEKGYGQQQQSGRAAAEASSGDKGGTGA